MPEASRRLAYQISNMIAAHSNGVDIGPNTMQHDNLQIAIQNVIREAVSLAWQEQHFNEG